MSSYFLDSSALLKHYVNEMGSAWVGEILHPANNHTVHTAAITEVEIIAALARRSKAPGAKPQEFSAAIASFRADFDSYIRVVEITPQLLRSASHLAEKYAMRGYDAVQLAAAIRINTDYQARKIPFSVVSADDELNAAAVAEGLRVENPNLHA